jgi:hypothetical protein
MKLKKSISGLALGAVISTLVQSATAGTVSSGKNVVSPSSGAETSSEPNWLTGENVSLGGVLFPHIHLNGAYGGSTIDDPERLVVGHHDPDREGLTIQALEFGLSARVGEYFEAFGVYAAKIDLDDKWDGDFEEYFGKIKNIPGGFEIRGGQYYNRFGIQNIYHPHSFDFVDQNLVNGRFLGDDGLRTQGGELTWKLPVSWTSLLSVSAGVAPELEEHEHAEGEEEPEFEAEGAVFNDVLIAANWTNQTNLTDYHQLRYGLSGVWGDNVWDETTQVYGVHTEYQWRANGLEKGGNYFRWRTEVMLRDFDGISGHLPGEEEEEHEHEEHEGEEHHDEHEEEGHDEHEEEIARRASLDEWGLSTSAVYGWSNGLALGLRADYVQGIAEAGLDERWRISPNVSYALNTARTAVFRLQYNYDHSSDFGSEHSVWAQIGINWGTKQEVR